MSLRVKSFLVLFVTLLVLVSAFSAISWREISRGFAQVEQNEMRVNVERVLGGFAVDLENLATKLSDWSSWDDTYAFIVDHNTAYISSNLQIESLTSLKINFMVFLDAHGKIIEEMGVNLVTMEPLAVPESFHDALGAGSPLLSEDKPGWSKTGLIMLADGPLVFASRPIFTSKGEGPSRGTLLFARYFDETQVARLTTTTRLATEAYGVSQKDVPRDVSVAREKLRVENPLIVPLGNDLVAAYTAISDVYDNPALLLRITHPREIFRQGQAVFVFVTVLGLIAGGITFFVMVVSLGIIVVDPVTKLHSDLQVISQNVNIGARVPEGSATREIAELRKRINSVLDLYEKSQEALVKVQKAIESSGEIIFMTDTEGIFTYVNPQFTRTYGFTREEVIGKTTPRILKSGKQSVLEYQNLWNTIKKRERYTYEITNKTKDEQLITVASSINLIEDGRGNILGFLAIQRNISEEKKTRDLEKKHMQDLERLNILMIGREVRMIELKREIAELTEKLKSKGL